MNHFSFADEIRTWIYRVNPAGKVWVYWGEREFRLYQPFDNHWAAEDVVSHAKALIA